MVLSQRSPTSRRHRIFIAEILDPTSIQRDKITKAQYQNFQIDRHRIALILLVAVLFLILTAVGLWIGLH